MSFLKRLFAAVLSLFFVSTAVVAAPITYTFSGLASGTLAGTPFTNAQTTITATGDTSTISSPASCGTAPTICTNALTSVTFTISGVGSGTVTDGLLLFGNPAAVSGAIGLERTASSIDWLDFGSPAFATYNLATSIGPITVTPFSPQGSVATTAGSLNITASPDTFQAVTAASTAPPTIAKSFGGSSVALGASTSLSFTITNPNASSSLSGVAFTDTLPAGLVVATPNGLTGSCGGGTITATAGSGSVSLTGATLASSAACTFSVNVTATAAGTMTNTTSAVSSVEGGSGGTASASVTVTAGGAVVPPTISKSFGASNVVVGASTSLTFTIGNPNGSSALSGVAFTDPLPAGLVVATPNALTGACGGGTITATAGSSSVSLAGATLAAGTSCNFTVNVTANTAGSKSNTTGAVTSTEGGTGGTASATLNVGTIVGGVKPVPTLQQWAIVMLGLLLAGFAAAAFRGRRR